MARLKPNSRTRRGAEVTCVAKASDGLELAVILDLFSRGVIGWPAAATPDETLVDQALSLALTRAANQELAGGIPLIGQVRRPGKPTPFLKELGIHVRMSRSK